MPLEKLGPYKLDKLLGRGGMGAVYAACHEETGDRAAVKLLSGHLADDPAFRERFKQEIETLKRLLHPNIVRLHGYGEEGEHLYYVMELVEGRNLQDELASGRRFGWREVVRIGVAVAQALKHAHDRGIIHRDLKPANLLIDEEDHVKLTDFGIAKLYGSSNVTVEGGVLGTADYMAPEQADGKPVTHRCDLYSLGSVLYALLTGKPPFAGRTVVEVIAALQKNAPMPVRRLAPDTPAEFEQIVLQLLEKDPQKRIPTALALANRLKAMEHALSLETKVEETQPDNVPAAEKSPRSSDKTAAEAFHASATQPLSGDEYRLVDDKATHVTTPPRSRTPAPQTQHGTQAGKRTSHGAPSSEPTIVNHAAATVAPASAAPASAAAVLAETAKTAARFTMVREEDLHQPADAGESRWSQWLLAAALGLVGLVAVAAGIYYAARPPAADRLYAAITEAAERGGGAELPAVEAEMTRFLELYPDDERASDVRQHREALEQYRLDRQLARSARRGTIRETTPAERGYQQALQLAASDPAAALDRFEALVAVFGPSKRDTDQPGEDQPKEDPAVGLARQQIERLRPLAERAITEERQLVERQLQRAAEWAASDRPPGDRAAAESIWRGVVLLYADKPWARPLVEQAQQRLAQPSAEPESAP
jgi:serine/threonine-protein kinase